MVKFLFPRITALACCLLVGLLAMSQIATAQGNGDIGAKGPDGPTTSVRQNPLDPATRVAVAKTTAQAFEQVDLFDTKNKSTAAAYDDAVANGVVFDLNTEKVATFLQTNPDHFTMKLPAVYGKKDFTLELVRSNAIPEDFKVYTSTNPDEPYDYTPGLHYHGIVAGHPDERVAISVFDNQVMGLIITEDGNYTLGKLEDSAQGHILYKDVDLKDLNDFMCDTQDDDGQYRTSELMTSEKALSDCVRVYVEVDRSVTNGAGGVVNATNIVTGMFNQSFVIYAGESINMAISEMFVWNSPDPYFYGSSSAQLSAFQLNTGAFNGDIGHLVSLQNIGGIAAGFSGLCNANSDNSLCFSGFSGLGFNTVPTYSFNVFIISHEMGHLLGSRHTHACVWNGNNTAIDGCSGFTEGPCPVPGSPVGGGTIMSYCHNDLVGVDFTQGFGPQPGNVIRNRVTNANCLSPCGATNNDLCEGAIELECGTPVLGTTNGYGDSDAPPACTPSVFPSDGAWFTITETTDQIVTISADNPGTDPFFDTGLTVYRSNTGCGGPYNCIAANDDIDTGNGNFLSSVTFIALANTTYYIYLDGFLNDTGDYELSVECEDICEEPEAVCMNTTVQLDASGNGSITASDVDGGSTAECGLQSMTVSPSSFNCSDVGANTVTLTITDINNDSDNCTATVTVEDNVAPDAVCQNTTVQLDANGDGSITAADIDGGSSDACGVASISATPTTFDCSDVGANTVVLTVTDVNGNSNTCNATVTVEDNVAPVITLCQGNPMDFNGQDFFLSEDYIDFDADDACGIASITYDPEYIYCDQLGQTVPVTVTVTDVNGNSDNCVANIDVIGLPCGWMDFGENGIGCVGGNDVEYDVPSETFTLESDGCYSSNWAADDAAYVKYEICGDGEIIAHVTAFNPIAGGWAGISARETEAPGAKKVALATNLGNFLRREIRTTTNGYSIPQQFFSPGKTWLKLVRNGSMFIGYASIDGNTWQMVMYANVAMTECIQFGLYATNTNGGVFTAGFDNVEVNEAGAVRLPETGNGIVDAQLFDVEDFSVFPNPAKEELNVDLSNYYGQQAQVEILNQLGQPIEQRQLDEVGSSPEQFDLNNLSNGTYFIRITTDKGDKVKRFLIVK